VKGDNATAVGIAVDNDSGSSTLDIAALGASYNAHGAAAGEVWFYSASNINIGGATTNTNDIKFLGSGSERMRITSAGNVGIGTDDINTKLHISGDFDASSNYGGNNPNKGILIEKRSGVVSDYSIGDAFGIDFTSSSNAANTYPVAGIYAITKDVASFNGGELHLLTKCNTDATLQSRMMIDRGGSVGIGTDATSPIPANTSLAVLGQGTNYYRSGFFRDYNGGGDRGYYIDIGAIDAASSTPTVAGSILGVLKDNDTDGYLRFYTVQSGTSTSNMYLDSTGVGIGPIGAPNYLLDMGSGNARNLRVGSRTFLGSGYSGSATILGYSVRAEESTNTNRMVATETSTGNGAPAAIRMCAGITEFHNFTSGTLDSNFECLRLRITNGGITEVYNNAAASTSGTNFRVYGFDGDSRFSLGNGGGNNDITMCMTDAAGNVKICMYGHSGNAFFNGYVDSNTCMEAPVFCATSTTIPLSITDSGVATYNWCFANDNVVSFMTNTTSTKTQYFCNAGSGSFNMCIEGCLQTPVLCGTTCLRAGVVCSHIEGAGLGCTQAAVFQVTNTTTSDNHYMSMCVDPGANVVYLNSTGASSGGFCILNCVISTCLCGTSCVKGTIVCGVDCVKSPVICGAGCTVADGELRVDRICGLNIGGDSGQQVTGAGGGSVYQWGYQAGGAWTSPFPDLVIGFHTGLILGANCTYGGTRFYSDHPHNSTAQIIFLVGCGNCNVCACYNLCAAGGVYSPIICATTTMQVGGNDVLTTASSVGVGFCALSDVNNRVVTANGASSLCGEANMTFDGSTLNVTGAITASGDITSTSDERVKCEIAAICGAIQIVNNLCGRVFIKDNREQVGVIAQEVEKVLPQVVFEHSNNDLKSVSYGNIVGVLIEAIKDQNKRIDELENIIQDMGYGSKK
jgi:hypothetical protein